MAHAIAASARLLLALAVLCLAVSACLSAQTDGRVPAPHETPIARDSGSVATADVTPPADEPAPTPTQEATASPGPTASPLPGSPPPTPLTPPPGASVAITPDGPASFPSTRPARGARAVPILMYHYIRVNPRPADRLGYSLSVAPADFEAQIAYLERRGYRSVTPADVVSGAAYLGRGRPVVITFDDGYEDAFAEAFPALTRHGFRATFYIITDYVGRPGYMTWDQVRALAAAGEVIGSHTESHPDLTRLDVVSLYAELAVSRMTLEGHVGLPVYDFCYPSGRNNLTGRNMVRSVGYQTGVTTQSGVAQPGDDPLALPRVRIYGGLTLDGFARLLEGGLPATPTRAPAS